MHFRYDPRLSLTSPRLSVWLKNIFVGIEDSVELSTSKEFQVSITNIIGYSSNFFNLSRQVFQLGRPRNSPWSFNRSWFENRPGCAGVLGYRDIRDSDGTYIVQPCAYIRPWHVRATARYDTRVQGSLAVTVARKSWREREREKEKGERKRIARQSPLLGKTFL